MLLKLIMVNVSERDTSEFNMAISYLNRLNNLFYEADRAAIELEAFTWFNVLLALYRELSTEMKEKEIEEFNKKIMNINNQISKNNKLIMKTGQLSIQKELYLDLHNFELYLRKVCKVSGLQLKMKEDPTKALM